MTGVLEEDVRGAAALVAGRSRGPGQQLPGYPIGWPVIAQAVKAAAGWCCEHCGRRCSPRGSGARELTVHHLDRRLENLQSWNLVALCLTCHGLVERLVDLDRRQVVLPGLAEPFPWLASRLRERELYPWQPSPEATEGEWIPPRPAGRHRLGTPVRACVCGCGQPVLGSDRRRIYAGPACRTRAWRDRQQAQLSWLAGVARQHGAEGGAVVEVRG